MKFGHLYCKQTEPEGGGEGVENKLHGFKVGRGQRERDARVKAQLKQVINPAPT